MSRSGKGYEIGRGRPPKATQWKKGKSANPGGRSSNFWELASLPLLALARSVNSSSALLASPFSAPFTSFFRSNSRRVARFVRPPSRYAVGVFWTSLTISPTSWPLRRLGRPSRLPETPFLNRPPRDDRQAIVDVSKDHQGRRVQAGDDTGGHSRAALEQRDRG
jgi:hypothetical protein